MTKSVDSKVAARMKTDLLTELTYLKDIMEHTQVYLI